MGAVKIAERPGLYPGHTVWRKTHGPCVYVGELITGVHVYLSEVESREVLLAWKWPTKEQHEALKTERDELAGRVKRLEEEIAPLRVLKEAMEENGMVSLVTKLGETGKPAKKAKAAA